MASLTGLLRVLMLLMLTGVKTDDCLEPLHKSFTKPVFCPRITDHPNTSGNIMDIKVQLGAISLSSPKKGPKQLQFRLIGPRDRFPEVIPMFQMVACKLGPGFDVPL